MVVQHQQSEIKVWCIVLLVREMIHLYSGAEGGWSNAPSPSTLKNSLYLYKILTYALIVHPH
jgi:hypothetical protein